MSFEDDAVLNHQARGHDIAEKTAGAAQLDALRCTQIAGDIPLDDDAARADLRHDRCRFTDDDGVLCLDLTFDLTVDADASLKRQRTFDATAATEVCLQVVRLAGSGFAVGRLRRDLARLLDATGTLVVLASEQCHSEPPRKEISLKSSRIAPASAACQNAREKACDLA